MSNRRQILQIALGAEACELTAHLVNLQGLAATSDESEQAPHCDLDLSHSVYNNLHVPRVLFIDEGGNMVRRNRLGKKAQKEDIVNDCWTGPVETMPTADEQDPLPANDNDAFDAFFDTATIMATNQHSRYRSRNKFQSTSRHVNWDEEDGMMMDDEDDHDRLERDKQAYKHQTQPRIQQQLEAYWDNSMKLDDTKATATACFNFLAPPYHPKSLLSLPRTSFDEDFDYYSYTHSMPWLDDECFERLRWMLEECDSCQGIVVTSSRMWGSGLATKLLQELEQEVPSASRWMINMSQDEALKKDGGVDGEKVDPPSWRTKQVQNVRRRMQTGLVLAEHSQHAHAILPLSNHIPCIQLAMALEAATLCYRLQPSTSQSATIALNSYYGGSYGGEFPFGTVPYLSFTEYLTSLKPSNTHLMLELDMLLPTTEYSFDKLRQGTSLERDFRMKHQRETSSKRPKEELPGLWMLDAIANNGLLSSCSPHPTDRSLHTHFCVSSAMRPAPCPATVAEQTLCLMEGMGIRYHPEQSIATVLPQSLQRLTEGGYAAGSYWKSLCNLKPSTTTLSVLGNTTRSFGLLKNTCDEMKSVFGPSLKGVYNRDVSTGVLPELEDVEHALSLVYNLRDTYRPPEGSGLASERETHFED